MSTKIYDAYRLPAGTDPFALPQTLNAYLRPIRLHLEAQQLVDEALRLIDDFSIHRDVSLMPTSVLAAKQDHSLYNPTWPMLAAERILADREAERNPSEIGHDEHRVEATVLTDGERIYIKFFVDHPELRAGVSSLAEELGWEDFHYQNQADRPDEVSDDEWATRGQVWSRMLGTDTFSERGLNYSLCTGYRTTPSLFQCSAQDAFDDCVTASKQQRLQRMVLGEAVRLWRAEADDDGLDISAMFAAYDRFGAGLKQLSGESEWKACLARMREFTPAELVRTNEEPVYSHDLSAAELRSLASTLL